MNLQLQSQPRSNTVDDRNALQIEVHSAQKPVSGKTFATWDIEIVVA